VNLFAAPTALDIDVVAYGLVQAHDLVAEEVTT